VKSIKRKLYPYQREGVERFLQTRHLLLADDMGLGKTTQAVAACHALFRAGAVRRGLLLVPASLKSQWIREWQATSDVPVQPVDGRPEERSRLYKNTRSGFLVMNYEQLLRDLPAVHRYAPDIVVLDEAQRIKNWATKSSVYVKTLSPEWRLVLTGTPMENRLEELASILDWVDDVALTPKWRLVPWHTTFEGDGGRGRSGARNLDTLRARLAPCTLRRIRRDVLAQLPPRTDTRVPVEMTEQQRAEHDELIQPIGELVHRAHRRPLTQAEFLKLMQMLTIQRIISNGLAQLRFDEMWPTLSRRAPDDSLLEAALSPKLFELRRLTEELVVRQNRKVVVFSQWRNMLRLGEWAMRDVLGESGRRAVFFTGAESQQQRTRSVLDLHDDPDVSVMFLTDAGGVGLNLQRAASACINLESPWNPAVLEQRIGRIYRLGQEQPIDVYNLVTEYGIESRIAILVASKKALFSGLFDGTSDEIRFDTAAGFLQDVERLVDPVEVPEFGQDDSAEAADSTAVDQALLGIGASGGTPAGGDAGPLALEGAVDASKALPPPGGAEPLDQAASASVSAPGVLNGESTGSAVAPPPDAPAAAREAGVGALLGCVRMSRTSEGGVRLEAPPEAADELIRLFEGMAALFRSSLG
jgi:SNF2 family DNA or RNA helicase